MLWEEYFKGLLTQRENSELELPSAVEGKAGGEWGCRGRESNEEDEDRPSYRY